MPKAGMAMEEGILVKWLKKEGDAVKKGEAIAEIETDKVTIEEESPGDGIMLKIIAQEGQTVPVTEIIAFVGNEGEEVPEVVVKKAEVEEAVAEEKVEVAAEKPVVQEVAKIDRISENDLRATPYAKRLADEKGIDILTLAGSGDDGAVIARDVLSADKNISPLAKKMAGLNSVDATGVIGSGYAGKIMKKDILKAIGAGGVKATREDKRVPLSGMRKVISQRMCNANNNVPPVTLTLPADVTALMELRKSVNEIEGLKISVNDFILRAVTLALEEFPIVNSSLDGDFVVYKKDINLGFAVGMDDGLLVPVVKNADQLHLFELSDTAKSLAKSAREGSLGMDYLSGGTFTVTNMGMFNITNFTPIINLPEVAILGVCAIEDKVVVINGLVAMTKVMNLCLTHDHRLLDGVVSAQFLNTVKDLLENPARLLL